jgi:acyl-CoA reductase-like NAD-dependent aldehyde dehydrogenase
MLIGGEWRVVSDVPTTPVHNPSTGEIIAECPGGNLPPCG